MTNLEIEKEVLRQLHERNIAELLDQLSARAIVFALMHDENASQTTKKYRGCWKMFAEISQVTSRNARYIKKYLELITTSAGYNRIEPKTLLRMKDALVKMLLEIYQLIDLIPPLVASCQIEDLPANDPALKRTTPVGLEKFQAAAGAELVNCAEQLKRHFSEVKDHYHGQELPLSGEFFARMEALENFTRTLDGE